MSVELWKQIFDWASVVLVGLTFVAGAGALITGKVLSDRQDERARQFSIDLTAAKTGLETQKQLTARAQKDASDAALALAKFKEPRSVSPEQQEKFIAVLAPFAGEKFALAIFPDPEALALARTIDTLLKSAGWHRISAQIQRENGVLVEVAGDTAATIFDPGVTAYIRPDGEDLASAQRAFCSALVGAGIPCETHKTPQLTGKEPKAITISVGKKPTA